jgi:redox-sensitive bicupin YhaK (pirin superfamily)
LEFGDGASFHIVATHNDPVRFLLVSGEPIREPIAWQGLIVMNTEEELATAFKELDNNTFIKVKPRR